MPKGERRQTLQVKWMKNVHNLGTPGIVTRGQVKSWVSKEDILSITTYRKTTTIKESNQNKGIFWHVSSPCIISHMFFLRKLSALQPDFSFTKKMWDWHRLKVKRNQDSCVRELRINL
jgi:hypothetical protein